MKVILCNADDRWQFADLARRRLFFLWKRSDVVVWDFCTGPQPDDELWPNLPRKGSRAGFALALAEVMREAGSQPVAVLCHINAQDANVDDNAVAVVSSVVAAAKAVGVANRSCLLLCSTQPLSYDLRLRLRSLSANCLDAYLLILSTATTKAAGAASQSAQLDLLGLVVLLTLKGELPGAARPLPGAVAIEGELEPEPNWLSDWRGNLEDVARWVDDQRFGLSIAEELKGPLAPLAAAVSRFINWMRHAPAAVEIKDDLAEKGRWLSKLRVGWWPLLPNAPTIAARVAQLWPDQMKIVSAEIVKVSEQCQQHQDQQTASVRDVDVVIAAAPPNSPPSVAAVEALSGMADRCRQTRLTRPDMDLALWRGGMLRRRLRRIVRRMLTTAIWWPRLGFLLLSNVAIIIIPGLILAVAAAELFIPASDPLRDALHHLTTAPVALERRLPLLPALWLFSGTGAVIGAAVFLFGRRRRALRARDRLIACSAALTEWFRNLMINNALNLWRRFDRRGIATVERRVDEHAESRRRRLRLAAAYAAPILPLDPDRPLNRQLANIAALPPQRWLTDLAAASAAKIVGENIIFVSDRRFPARRPIAVSMPPRHADIEIRNI